MFSNSLIELAAQFDFESAFYQEDTRKNYGEARYAALGYLSGRLHVLIFTPIDDGVRVISLRKANKREVRRYEQEAKS